jgi:hypothetical protein
MMVAAFEDFCFFRLVTTTLNLLCFFYGWARRRRRIPLEIRRQPRMESPCELSAALGWSWYGERTALDSHTDFGPGATLQKSPWPPSQAWHAQ